MKNFPEPKFIENNSVHLAVYESPVTSPNNAPPIILVHGWPEMAYSWKHQISALANAGFRAIAIDVRGFGNSGTPHDMNAYNILHLTSDLLAVLDGLEIEKAIFCGHDWGGAQVWPMAQLHPDRVEGVIGICTPHRAPPPLPPLAIIEKRFSAKHYFIQFQEDGVVEKLFEQDIDRFFKMVFQKPAKHRDIKESSSKPNALSMFDLPGRFADPDYVPSQNLVLSAQDLSEYITAYEKSGLRGGINIYRNIDQNHEIMKSHDPVIKIPSLWIGAGDDVFLPPEGADGMEELVPDLEKHIIDRSGHWVTWEKPTELNDLMIDWLKRRFCH